MERELESLIEQFEGAERHLQRVVSAATEEELNRRPPDGGWSAAECIAHLNLTGQAYRPILRDGLAEARKAGRSAGKLKLDLLGWLLVKSVGPSRRFKSKTPAAFVPTVNLRTAELVKKFRTLQAEQIEVVRQSTGLPIDRVKVVSPFDPRGRYSIYSALRILAAHQERHLNQADAALNYKP
jgi:hypothetical protein